MRYEILQIGKEKSIVLRTDPNTTESDILMIDNDVLITRILLDVNHMYPMNETMWSYKKNDE